MQVLRDPKPEPLWQSKGLVCLVGPLLILIALWPLDCLTCNGATFYVSAGVVSLTFGVAVWALRAATPAAAFFGALICDILIVWTGHAGRSLMETALLPLALLFVLTFLSTRLGKRRRPALTSDREAKRGRNAAQIIANLGMAALVVPGGALGWYDWTSRHVSGLSSISIAIFPCLVLAALAEATADTVSSEIGQAFGGTPYLLTTFRAVAPGTDGAISLLGTTAGIAGAALVTATGWWALGLGWRMGLTALAGGVAGLFFDSLLGATLERRGWLNNDLVNFCSTAFAALVAVLLLAI